MYDFFRFALITVLAAVGAGTSNAGYASSALAGHVFIRSPLNAAEQSAPSSVPSSSGKPSSAKSEAPKLDAALAAEFAAADKRPEDAARLYLDAAKAENRGDFAERAVRLALSARNFGLAETAAALWVKVAPNNLNALQAQAFAMIAQGIKDAI